MVHSYIRMKVSADHILLPTHFLTPIFQPGSGTGILVYLDTNRIFPGCKYMSTLSVSSQKYLGSCEQALIAH